jgi:hypothetical protein
VGEPTEFGVHDGRQRVERALVAVAPGAKQGTDVALTLVNVRSRHCPGRRMISQTDDHVPSQRLRG